MKLSIVIPNYNGSKTILKTIKSIPKEYEIIVVDDCSTDDSVKLIEKKFPKVKVVKLDKNSGAAKARNTGVKDSKGELILFIDSDMWLTKNAIEDLVKGTSKVDITFPKIVYENKQVMYPLFKIEKQYPHISGCFLIKKKSFEKILFDENYGTYLEDYDFFIRCSLAGLKAKYVDKAKVMHANKGIKDYTDRYYIEVRNTVYAMLKKLPEQSKVYNPFTVSTLTKMFIFGVYNFAWFNWQGYNRKSKKINFSNRITHHSWKLPFVFVKAIIDVIRKKFIGSQISLNMK